MFSFKKASLAKNKAATLKKEEALRVLPPDLIRAREMARWLDSAYRIPFINKTIGLDPLLAMLPFFIGDIIGLVFSLYIMQLAYQLGCPKILLFKMLRNVLIDFGAGAVPLAGPLLDAYWKANRMNLAMLEKAWRAEGHKWVARAIPLPEDKRFSTPVIDINVDTK